MSNELGGSEQGDRERISDDVPRLSDDNLYRALASTRRRRLLYLLLEEGRSTIDTVTTVLTGWNATDSETMATPEDREQILVTLEHVHLPLLDETGMITYDSDDRVIDIEPLDPVVDDLIRRSVDAESRSTT